MINHKVDWAKERRRKLEEQRLLEQKEKGEEEKPKLRRPGDDYRDELKKLNEGRELSNDPMFVVSEDPNKTNKRKRRPRVKRQR